MENVENKSLNEQTYDNLQGELDQLNSELEKNPDNKKLIEYARQTTEIMLDILNRLDDESMPREEAQGVGAKTMSGNPMGQERYYNSRGEIYTSREDALESEAK